MKNLFLTILFIIPGMLMAATPDYSLEKSADESSTKVSLYVPGFLMEMGSWFVPKKQEPELKSALQKIRSTSIVVREGEAYVQYNASRKYEKKINKLDRQQFEELVSVTTEEENVSVQLRQNKKNKIRQVVVLVDDGTSSFVFLRVRCNIGEKELKKWMEQDEILGEEIHQKISI
ncbi:MAG: DUF4252 domain-containing protein [Chitinophagales bacterium]|nr:DUF4252 domain-containing protein [Chitinophagales bacterium]